jgi:hypothetical protein
MTDETPQHPLAQLAEDQGIGPVRDLSEFATMRDIDDDELRQFVRAATSAR